MARARRSASSSSKRSTSKSASRTSSSETLTCPECGREFARPAALGAHRSRVHGVAGASKRARRLRAGRRGSRSAPATAGTGKRSTSAAASRGDGTIDRDALLSALFPNGVPPRESVIREVSAWLDHAEQLAKRR
jgi:hypothetical protein